MTIDLLSSGRLLSMHNGSLTLRGVTIKNGMVGLFGYDGGGALKIYNSDLALDDVHFVDNQASAFGGALAITLSGSGKATIHNTLFQHNHVFGGPGVLTGAAGGGASVALSGAGQEIHLTDVGFNHNIVEANEAVYGGGLDLGVSFQARAACVRCFFNGNQITESGGEGIAEGGGAMLTVSLRVPVSIPLGNVTCWTVSLVPAPAIDPDFATASFTPNGTTGSVSSIASLSTSVSALPSTFAESTSSTFTR